jgi:hypothetical protein
MRHFQPESITDPTSKAAFAFMRLKTKMVSSIDAIVETLWQPQYPRSVVKNRVPQQPPAPQPVGKSNP